MTTRRLLGLSMVLGIAALLSACESLPGQPHKDSTPLAPNDVRDFDTLYAANCAGCHGPQGKGGAALALANPVYLEVAYDDAIRKAVSGGVPGTSMPAFGQIAGGMLTEEQVEVLATGMRSRWSRPGTLAGTHVPTYAPKDLASVQQGEVAYGTYCASCHGAGGQGGEKAGAITNQSFLALVSDHGLRMTVIAGRPELGAPDWRGNVSGHAMSEQEITDVVAWLASHRVQTPGQPYIPSNDSSH